MKSHKNAVFLSILTATSVFLSPQMAVAAIDAAGAEALKALLTPQIERQKTYIKSQGGTVTTTGDLTITPMGTYYAATYPSYTITSDDVVLNIGALKSNLMPGAKPTQWKATLALPPQWTIQSKTDGPVGTLKIGAQKCSYTFDTDYLVMPGFAPFVDCAFDQVKFTSTKPSVPFTLNIGRIATKTNLTQDANALFSGTIAYQLENISMNGKDTTGQQVTGNVARVDVTGSIKGLDAKKYTAYIDSVQSMNMAFQDMDPKGTNAANAQKMADAATGMNQMIANLDLSDDSDGQATLTGLEFTATKPGEKPQTIKIATLTYGGSISSMRTDKQTAKMNLAVKGMDAQTDYVAPELKPFLASDMMLSLTGTNIPFKQILGEFATLTQTSSTQAVAATTKCVGAAKAGCEGMAEQHQMQKIMDLGTKIPQLMATAGSVITLDNTGAKAPGHDVAVTGSFKPKATGPYYGTGTLKIVFTGMDALVKGLQDLAQKPGLAPETAAQATQMVTALSVGQMMGAQGTGTNGAPARVYDFVLDDTGRLTMNGADMGALTQRPGAAPNTPATPAPQAPSK